MSILDINSASLVPSKEARLAALVNRIKRSAADTFRVLVDTQKNGSSNVWDSKEFTPQEIVDALGDDALKIFQLHGKLTDFLQSVIDEEGVQVELKKPKFKFTVSNNGKITVTDQPYSA